MVLFGSRNSVRSEDVIPDISAPILLRMTAIRNSMRVERRHQFIEDKHHGGFCGQGKMCYDLQIIPRYKIIRCPY